MILYILFLFFHTIKVTHDLSSEFPISTDNNGNICRNKFKMKIRNKIFKQKHGSPTSPYKRNIVTLEQSSTPFNISDDIHNIVEANIEQFLKNFTPIDQFFKDFTPIDQFFKDNTTIAQYFKDFTHTEQSEKDYTHTDQIERKESFTQSNERSSNKNIEGQDNLTVSNIKIQKIAKKVIYEQYISLYDKFNGNLETLKFKQNLDYIKIFAHIEELTLLIESYEKLYYYFQNERILSKDEILKVLNEAIEISSDSIKYRIRINYMIVFYNKYKTLIENDIPFLREKILQLSITKEEKIVFFFYFDYFQRIATYILNYKANENLCRKTYVFNLYKYIRLMIQMPEFLLETNYEQIFDDFVKKVESLKFDKEYFFKSDRNMLYEFKTKYTSVLKTTEKRTETIVKCCAYILQNYF